MRAPRLPAMLLIAAAVAVATLSVVDRMNDEDYRPMVAQAGRDAASSGEMVRPITTGQADRWDCCGGPTWAHAQELLGNGNYRLAEVYRQMDQAGERKTGRAPHDAPVGDFTCLYWPIVERAGDPLGKAVYVTRQCYLATRLQSRPYWSSTTSTTWD